MRQVEYQIAVRDGLPPEKRKAYIFTFDATAELPAVDLAVYRRYGDWCVDHLKSGRCIPNIFYRTRKDLIERLGDAGCALHRQIAEGAERFDALNPEFN